MGKEENTVQIPNFRLPRYGEIPTVGLYLEQVTRYIADCLSPIQTNGITNSMIANYVKKHLITNPVKKQYDRDQIACLIFIAVAKSVLSLEQLKQFILLHESLCTTSEAYDYFCDEMEKTLTLVFREGTGLQVADADAGQDVLAKQNENIHAEVLAENTAEKKRIEKRMLHSAIIAVSHKIYLEKCFEAMGEE